MAGLFDRMRGRSRGSAQDAKERLQFILFHDRIDLPPEQLEAMKREILEVISKYVSIEQDRVDIALQQRQRDSLLVAEIPFSKPPDLDAELVAEMQEEPKINLDDEEDE
jgi:cell division topological specificity factor